MQFAKVYAALRAKLERKGRTAAELDLVIRWLTGHDPAAIASLRNGDCTMRDFFASAPKMNPDRAAIKGLVCGVRVEEVAEPLMREIRYLDKLVDDLAKGRPIARVLPDLAA